MFCLLFCLVNYTKKKKKKKKKKTAMNSHYTIKKSHPPTASQIQKIIFPSTAILPWVPLNINTNTRTPVGPTKDISSTHPSWANYIQILQSVFTRNRIYFPNFTSSRHGNKIKQIIISSAEQVLWARKVSKKRVNFMLPEAFPGQNQIIFLLNESIVSQLILFYAIISPRLLLPRPRPHTHTHTHTHTERL